MNETGNPQNSGTPIISEPTAEDYNNRIKEYIGNTRTHAGALEGVLE